MAIRVLLDRRKLAMGNPPTALPPPTPHAAPALPATPAPRAAAPSPLPAPPPVATGGGIGAPTAKPPTNLPAWTPKLQASVPGMPAPTPAQPPQAQPPVRVPPGVGAPGQGAPGQGPQAPGDGGGAPPNQAPGFMDRLGALPGWQQALLAGGLGVGTVGLLSALQGRGGLPSWLMAALGLGGSYLGAAHHGLLDPGSQEFSHGLMDFLSGYKPDASAIAGVVSPTAGSLLGGSGQADPRAQRFMDRAAGMGGWGNQFWSNMMAPHIPEPVRAVLPQYRQLRGGTTQ